MENGERHGNRIAVLTVKERAPFAGGAGLCPVGAPARRRVVADKKKGAHGGNIVSPMPETMVIDGGQYFH
jgi:hypothetical protein